jgi:hypothetical protein
MSLIERLQTTSFDEWMSAIFDQPEPGGFAMSSPRSRVIATRYMTRLFNHSGALLAKYDDATTARGLKYLLSLSNHSSAPGTRDVALGDAVRWLDSIEILFRQIFAARLPDPHAPNNPMPLAIECFMWWDVLPYHGTHTGRAFNEALLGVLERQLLIRNEACRESALHGLGHWAPHSRRTVQRIVDRFLRRTHGRLSPWLRDYARKARRGGVR